jgi:serine protease Do
MEAREFEPFDREAEGQANQGRGSPRNIPVARPVHASRSIAALLFGLTSFLLVFLIAAFATPLLFARWRSIESKAEAEAVYAKRRAELRAEADAADERLKALDKRVNLISLGFREVVRKVGPAVVDITCYTKDRDPRTKDGKEQPPAEDTETGQTIYQAASGSGCIVEPNLVVTNYHVVQNAYRLRVTFFSGLSLIVKADAIKTDPETDLALIHLPAAPPGVSREDDSHRVEFANSDEAERGDLVLALGSPLGLRHSVAHGIISAKGRLLANFTACELLQTDTQINKGNSGGPLFDHQGRLLGINCAIVSDTGLHQGIAFAIPSNTVKDVYQQLRDHGEVLRGYLGLEPEDLRPGEVKELGVGRAGAVRVVSVRAGPAHDAGIRTGDVIVKYNGVPLAPGNASRQLIQMVMDTPVGSQVQVLVVSEGRWRSVLVTVGKRPPRKR